MDQIALSEKNGSNGGKNGSNCEKKGIVDAKKKTKKMRWKSFHRI